MTYHFSNVAPVTVEPYEIPVSIKDSNNTPGVLGTNDLIASYLTDNLIIKPLNARKKPLIADNSGATLKPDDIAKILSASLHNQPDPAVLDQSKELLSGLLTHSDIQHNLPTDQMFLSQALGVTGLPSTLSKATVIYDINTDIIPSATDYLATYAAPNGTYAEAHESLLAMYIALLSLYQVDGQMLMFATNDDFDAFTEAVINKATALHSAGDINNDVLAQAQQLRKFTITDDIATGINVLGDDEDSAAEGSFARVIGLVAHEFFRDHHTNAQQNNTPEHAIMTPWSLHDAANPRRWVFVNIENHARSSSTDIHEAWTDVQRSCRMPVTKISLNKLKRINATSRNAQRLKKSVAQNRDKRLRKRVERRHSSESNFAQQPVSPQQSIRDIVRVMKAMSKTTHSHNPQLVRKKTYNRPSRRHRPYADAAAGKIKRKTYYPDIHFYADTSGSMSLEDYQDTLMLVIAVAKKLNCNVYFSSFSHILSSEILLPIKGKSMAHMHKVIKNIPKVDGGTDFNQVWDNINNLTERKRRLNIIATDFGFTPRSYPKIDHPTNTVYVPSFDRRSPYGWDAIRRYASDFINYMRPHDNHIDSKILGMGYTPPR